MIESAAAVLLGIAMGFIPSSTFLYFMRELRQNGWNRSAAGAATFTVALLGGEAWIAAQFADFLFQMGEEAF
jgi:hypothetical protein